MRPLTRSDFDGSACAALLRGLGLVDEILYIHPKDLQDNKIEVTANDIIANVPFVEGCGMWFDHHSSEHERLNWEESSMVPVNLHPAPLRSFMTIIKKIRSLAAS